MCHSPDSAPPAAPGAGEVADHGPLVLTAEDGTMFAAHQATPATPNGSAVVLLPDARGAHPYYESLAQRLAEAGFATVVVDYYGRTAGLSARDDSFDFIDHWRRAESTDVVKDVRAAIDWLAEHHPGPVFSVGFCWGGGQSWRLSGAGVELAGSIGFYGLPNLVDDVLDDLSAPLLLVLAGDDAATTTEQFTEFTERLDAAGKPHEVAFYPGTPHSFFDRGFDEWKDACDDAWRRVLNFTQRHSSVAVRG
jgi:carboxymethylenebutenolidase